MNAIEIESAPQPIDDRVERLLISAKSDKNKADQLAIDASKLLTLSRERLEKYQGAGFTKRLWFAATGKNAKMQRATVTDLVEMQSVAHQYLMALQKQNLISARAIAVVMNNLHRLGDRHEQLSDLVLALAKRTGAALEEIQDDVAVLRWLVALEAQDEFRQMPEVLRVLKLSYEYASLFKGRTRALDRVDTTHDLALAFRKLDLNVGREINLLDFGDEIAEGLMNIGVDQFCQITNIQVGEYTLAADKASQLVSGAAFDCVGGISKALPSITKYIDRESGKVSLLRRLFYIFLRRPSSPKKCSSFVRRFLIAQVDNSDATYRLLDLSKEIVAGATLARDLSLPVEESNKIITDANARLLSVDELLAQNVPVKMHALAKFNPSNHAFSTYLDWLIITGVEGQLGKGEKSYLTSIARVMNFPFDEHRADLVLKNPQPVAIGQVREVLCDQERQYTWLLEAVYLGSSSEGGLSEVVRNRILDAAKVFDLKVDEVKKFVDLSGILATSIEPKIIASTILDVSLKSSAWRTIIDHRKISLSGAFDGQKLSHNADHLKAIVSAFGSLNSKLSSSGKSNGDEGLWKDAGIGVERSDINKEFRKLSDEVSKYASGVKSFIANRNVYLEVFGLDEVRVDEVSGVNYCKPDENRDAKNTAWTGNTRRACDTLRSYFDVHVNAAKQIESALSRIESGDWC